MFEDSSDLTSGQAILWSNSNNYIFPQDIENVRLDILANSGVGFTVYWEQHGPLNHPGEFIVVVRAFWLFLS